MIVKNRKYNKAAINYLITMIMFFITSNKIIAQDYIFQQIKIEDGLSQSTIFASLQDSKGYMWFATRSGLNRYDGYKFVIYTNDPKDSTTLSDDGTNSLFEDKNGVLWIGTVEGNINRFDRSTETFNFKNISSIIRIIPEQSDDFFEYPLCFSRNQSSTITCIKEDNEGTLWIGTWGEGIINIDKNFNLKNHLYSDGKNLNSLRTNRITDLQFDETGRLWVATFGGGLTRITKSKINSNETFTFENLSQGTDEFSLSDNKLLTLYEDSEKNIWIGSYYGGIIFISEEETKKTFGKTKLNCQRCPTSSNRLSRNTVISLTEDKNKNLWIGTFGGGLIRYNYRNNESFHFFNDPLNKNSLGDNDVLSLSTDRSGIIWAGSHLGAGITKIQVNNAKFHHIKHDASKQNSLNDDVVWSIYKDASDILWIGTYKGGINIYNPSTKSFSSIKNSGSTNSVSSNHIRVIKEDGFGNLWVGTYDGGLNIISKKTKEIKIYKSDENRYSQHQRKSDSGYFY